MKTLLATLLLVLSYTCLAEDGYVHGDNHCYYFNTPSGWVLDNASGKKQGIPMVFYPKNSSWANATTIIYTRNADFAAGARTPQEKIKGQVSRVLEEFRASGDGPALKASMVKTMKTKNGANGELWKFSGDRWGNSELVAYFIGSQTVNFFVMSSRDTKDFERSTPALLEIASSYREGNDCVPCETKNIMPCSGHTEAPYIVSASLTHAELFDVRVQLGKTAEGKEEFKAYQPAMFAQVGDHIAHTMRSCFATTAKSETAPFVLVADISPEGKAEAVEVKPATNIAKCFATGFTNAPYPKPPQYPNRRGFPVTIEMRVTP